MEDALDPLRGYGCLHRVDSKEDFMHGRCCSVYIRPFGCVSSVCLCVYLSAYLYSYIYLSYISIFVCLCLCMRGVSVYLIIFLLSSVYAAVKAFMTQASV